MTTAEHGGQLNSHVEKRHVWVQDALTGEMVQREVEVVVYDLSHLPPAAFGETITIATTRNLMQ